ncbi:MAG: hypothetical protein GY714_28130 [Desulfobacterales bacterium]|nr:hypothetical protein [Desulfobacterales bacterium]MCP4159367.1 hypothetical protein [Deltaproteobacteria bacterium]
MRKNIIRNFSIITSVLYILVGIVHCIFGTPQYSEIYQRVLESKVATQSTAFFFYYGVFIIFLGLLSIYSFIKIEEINKFRWNVVIANNVTLLFIIAGTSFYSSHIGKFSILLTVFSFLNVCILLKFKRVSI